MASFDALTDAKGIQLLAGGGSYICNDTPSSSLPQVGSNLRSNCPCYGLFGGVHDDDVIRLVELEAHDWKTGVAWLTGKRKPIAQALYEGICRDIGLRPKDGRIELTDENVSVPRQKRPHRAGWWNLGPVPYIGQVRAQGSGASERAMLRRPPLLCRSAGRGGGAR